MDVYSERPKSAERGLKNVAPMETLQSDKTKIEAGMERLFCKIRAAGRRYFVLGQT